MQNPKTLGLRLNRDPIRQITNIDEYLGTYFGLLMGTGESHISQTLGNYRRGIFLDSMGIGLLDFNPDQDQLDAAQQDAQRRVLRYFGFDLLSTKSE